MGGDTHIVNVLERCLYGQSSHDVVQSNDALDVKVEYEEDRQGEAIDRDKLRRLPGHEGNTIHHQRSDLGYHETTCIHRLE